MRNRIHFLIVGMSVLSVVYPASGTQNYLPKCDVGGTNPINSIVYETGGNIGVGTTNPAAKLDVSGDIRMSGTAAKAKCWCY